MTGDGDRSGSGAGSAGRSGIAMRGVDLVVVCPTLRGTEGVGGAEDEEAPVCLSATTLARCARCAAVKGTIWLLALYPYQFSVSSFQ